MEKSLEECLKVLATDPRNTEALNSLGHFFAARNHVEEAATCLRYVLEIDPRNTEAMNGMAEAAWQEFDLWVQSGKDQQFFYDRKGACISKVIEWCGMVLAVDPKNSEALENLAKASEARFNLDRAVFAQEHDVL